MTRFYLAGAFIVCAFQNGSFAEEKISFSRDIRPILSEHCFACHGPDAKTREADLRLDTADGIVAGEVVLQGKPNESLLLERILSDDEDGQMPPPDHERLSEHDIGLIKSWIEQGAEIQQHWPLLHRSALPRQ